MVQMIDVRNVSEEKVKKEVVDYLKNNKKAYPSDIADALQIAGQDIAGPYRSATAGLAEKVSSNYDQLCEKEERRNQVKKTVEDAFAAVEKEEEMAKPAT